MKKLLVYILTLNLMAPATNAATEGRFISNEELENSQKMIDILLLQREIGKLESQIQDLKEAMDKDKSMRTGMIMLSGSLVVVAGSYFKVARRSTADISDAVFGYLFGGTAGVFAVGAGAHGAYKHYQIQLTKEQLLGLEIRIKRLQIKLDLKTAEINQRSKE